ncbi:hypothetical protein [Kribbella pittospori]|uniref:hypothetical protein n=1 Tax=Kribbella pittospori TaxID=722689 RepID=UPI0013F4274E|nr:hypothetical protein [Kribbella pittospori]
MTVAPTAVRMVAPVVARDRLMAVRRQVALTVAPTVVRMAVREAAKDPRTAEPLRA